MYEVTCKTTLSIKGWVKNELRGLWEMFRGPEIRTNNNITVLNFMLPISESDAEVLWARGIGEEKIAKLMEAPRFGGSR